MKNQPSIHNRFTRPLAARVLGACLAAGLAVAAATPAQAVIFNPNGNNDPNGAVINEHVLDLNSSSPGAYTAQAAFAVQVSVQGYGWIKAFGTTGESRRLEAIRVTQLNDQPNLCLQANVATQGWMNQQCTSGKGSTVEVGTTGRSLAIQAVAMSCPNFDPQHWALLYAQAHVASTGWQIMQALSCGSTPDGQLVIGTPGGPPIQAINLDVTGY